MQHFRNNCPLTLTVITEAHLGLAKSNGVLALTNAIELFEFCLVDTLWRG